LQVKDAVAGSASSGANFGQPLFREAYAETTKDVDGLERGLAAIEAVRRAHCAPALLAG